jgi:hypothetical protein
VPEPGVFELGTDGPSLILAALDGSETSMRAAAYAVGLARRQGARITLVYVHTVGTFSTSVAGAIPAIELANRQTAADLRESIESNSVRLGVQAEFVERSGSPFTEITTLPMSCAPTPSWSALRPRPGTSSSDRWPCTWCAPRAGR